jgi:superfamily I DNA/RNA helicase
MNLYTVRVEAVARLKTGPIPQRWGMGRTWAGVIPLQERIETVGAHADLQEVYDTERHLLYVDCTRARDHLLVTSGNTPSEFLDNLRA